MKKPKTLCQKAYNINERQMGKGTINKLEKYKLKGKTRDTEILIMRIKRMVKK